MNRVFLLLGLLMTLPFINSRAQSPSPVVDAYSKGQSTVNLGYGFLNRHANQFYMLENGNFSISNTSNVLGPVSFSYEYAIKNNIGIGLYVSYGTIAHQAILNKQHSNGGNYIVDYDWTQMTALVRGIYHIGDYAKLDPYVGLGLGYMNVDLKISDNDPNSDLAFDIKDPSPIAFSVFGGLRYYFNQSFGLYTEVGYTEGAVAQLGIALKFGGGVW